MSFPQSTKKVPPSVVRWIEIKVIDPNQRPPRHLGHKIELYGQTIPHTGSGIKHTMGRRYFVPYTRLDTWPPYRDLSWQGNSDVVGTELSGVHKPKVPARACVRTVRGTGTSIRTTLPGVGVALEPPPGRRGPRHLRLRGCEDVTFGETENEETDSQ